MKKTTKKAAANVQTPTIPATPQPRPTARQWLAYTLEDLGRKMNQCHAAVAEDLNKVANDPAFYLTGIQNTLEKQAEADVANRVLYEYTDRVFYAADPLYSDELARDFALQAIHSLSERHRFISRSTNHLEDAMVAHRAAFALEIIYNLTNVFTLL